MEVLRAEYQREGDVSRPGWERWRERMGEREKGRVRNNNKKWIKIVKKEYLNEVVKENRMFDV